MGSNNKDTNDSDMGYINHHEELELRMKYYDKQPNLLTIFQQSYQLHQKEFFEAAQEMGFLFFDEQGKINDPSTITLAQIEDITRKMGSCGYDFLESGLQSPQPSFFKYMPLRYQPYLDELFEFAFHRELEEIQYHLEDFILQTHLSDDEINAMDFGGMEVTLTLAEKVSKGLYISAFELMKREYILFAVSKIRKYNPHRAFHRVDELDEQDKHIIMGYIRYIIQGDRLVTAGEISFVEKVVPKLKMENFDLEYFKESLVRYMSVNDLQPLTSPLLEPIRRQILGLIVDCAYSDRMLLPEEQPRILEVAQLVLGFTYH